MPKRSAPISFDAIGANPATGVGEHGQALIAGVCNIDSAAVIHGDSFGLKHLTRTGALVANATHEGAGRGEYDDTGCCAVPPARVRDIDFALAIDSHVNWRDQ